MSVATPEKIIEVTDVSYSYGSGLALEHITLPVLRGDYLGVIGPNGGGKTTLLKLMLGLLPVQEGTVKLFGVDIKDFRDWWKIGYVPQKAVNFDARFPATVAEVVAMGRSARRGIGRRLTKVDYAKVADAIASVNMSAYHDRLIGTLSSGQQQRVFIARALASKPEVLFLDEPTVGVDAAAQGAFYQLLKTLNEERALTLILVSHDIDVVASQATQIACINGHLICHLPPKNFNASEYIKNLYGKDITFVVHDH
ncbi:zinc ABC transporter ATP-binding protein [Candidatus Uhrbacteria bacterium CG10_big_fil_rev_8_21_14_0_10_48_11]|uniref:Zinc ABC transporter ATP-binding protein n=1 Tax=Candidatus Uhrbacteria bacterium CG10_big_fil_rev_8_21_14_0_10_48_11 TaxID=1975037 RepID=A0A2M8LFA0_9BACT|nr:MAG: zinc ABC transporter ATP-binding protein [Candidatus Uhrbacteria bacterium CG10_big_fil_rev_8_21_14_0_10_48_11]